MTLWIPERPCHTTILGQTRSGKTSSSGRQLMLAWLSPRAPPPQGFMDRLWGRPPPPARPPPGFLGCVVKPDEGDNLCRTLKLAGRENDVVRVTVGGPWHCDPLHAYMGFRGRSVAQAANLIGQLSTVVSRGNRGGDGENGFWRMEGEQLLYVTVGALAAALDRPTMRQVLDFLSALPTPESVKSGSIRKTFYHRVMQAGGVRGGGAFPREFETAVQYFTGRWLRMPDKTRESITPHAVQLVFPFCVSPIAELCEGAQALHPSILTEGACVILDVSILRYGLPALMYQCMMKMLCDVFLMDHAAGQANVIAWQDEYPWMCIPQWDLKVQTTAAEAGYVQVKLFQTIPVLIDSVGGPHPEQFCAGLLANSALVLTHAVSNCTMTQELMSRRCGDRKQLMFSASGGGQPYDLFGDLTGQRNPSCQVSFSEQYQPNVRPHELSRLRTGGPDNGWVCDALCMQTGKPHQWVSVPQVIFQEG